VVALELGVVVRAEEQDRERARDWGTGEVNRSVGEGVGTRIT